MKEVTRIYDCKVTMIGPVPDEDEVIPTEKALRETAFAMKIALCADNLEITDCKVFANEKGYGHE